ncbi:hypothetical protein DEO72_LG8g1898 [Vigna unguiculata]|uniref:Uncharacterized protein n=1 Tax=Vigna unguiculata TaxID=3917 RepID=A0A4D6MUS4_VIGUN|nr:hypothetical protein DEO72_LG8g1898 [Vigna unguiculata]
MIIAKHKQISTLTPATLANPSSTQGMPFRAQLEECHMLDSYPELNSRDTFRA